MFMKKFLLLLGLTLSAPVFAQSSGSVGVGDFKASANIENACLISAANINFGQVFAPLTNQGSQSQMRVQCSNKASYTIGLAYGGVYGTGSPNSAYSISYTSYSSDSSKYEIFNSSGVSIGSMNCGYGPSSRNSVFFSNTTVSNLFGVSVAGWSNNLVVKACVSDNTLAGTYPKGWVGAFNATGRQTLGGPGYAYGVMNGALKGDMLAYKITVPGDITKVWNTGNSSYTATGTGAEQVINMNAQIVPGNSSSLYPAQDMYTDTVTAVIAY